jgi:hypothetical protein
MTTNIELFQLAKKNNIKLDHILYKDELPLLRFKNGLHIILNLASENHSGTHWVSLVTNKNKVYYFDSFGAIPTESVFTFSKGRKIVYNDYQIQHFNETDCGQLSLYFLIIIRSSIH